MSYYDNGIRVGTVQLHSDFFNNPIAFFPGPDGDSVICFSFLDATYATFVVDLAKREEQVTTIPLKLQVPTEPVVDRSDFVVRACTASEVAYVEHYIKTVDQATLSNLVRGGAGPETRENMLRHLAWSTKPNDWRDPILKDAKPQVLPEP